MRERTLSPRARELSGVFRDAPGSPPSADDVFYFSQCEAPPTEAELRVGHEVLLAARDRCAAIGARLLVAYIPRKFRVYADLCTFAADSPCARWISNDMPARLAQWTASENIAFVDFTPALTESATRGEHVYFTDDVHWNTTGHAVAARVIMHELRERGWLSR